MMAAYFVLVLITVIGRVCATVMILLYLTRIYRSNRKGTVDGDVASIEKRYNPKRFIMLAVLSVVFHLLWIILYYTFDQIVANMSAEMFSSSAGLIALSRLIISSPGIVGMVGCVIALAVIWHNIRQKSAGDS